MFVRGVGDTSNLLYFKLRDSSTGAPKTGLLYNSAGAFCSYVRPKAAAVDIALATQTVTGDWVSGGFVEIDAVKAPGLYRLDVPDGVAAVGVGFTLVTIGFSGVLAETVEVILDPMPDAPSGVVVGDAANTSLTFKTNLPSTLVNAYKDAWILFRTGTLGVQVKQIAASAADGFLTLVGALTGVPGNNDSFIIVNR